MTVPRTAEGLQPVPAPPMRRSFFSRLSMGHVVMIVAGLLALLLNFSLLRARSDTFPVVVTATELRPGVPVTADSFRLAEVRVDDQLATTLLGPTDLGGIEGWIATDQIPAGELVTRSDLRPPSAPSDLRAMSIPIDPAHAVAGDLQPGDQVDVIHVADGTATYVVTSAPVLGVQRGSSGSRAALPASGGFGITLAVNAETALRLALAINEGGVEVVRSTGAPTARVPSYPPPAEPPIEESGPGLLEPGGEEGGP